MGDDPLEHLSGRVLFSNYRPINTGIDIRGLNFSLMSRSIILISTQPNVGPLKEL